MKHVICYLAVFILMIPAFILGCISYVFNAIWYFRFGLKEFQKGSQWLHEKYNYGRLLDNLLER